jgi:hypothetical protein
VAATPTAMLTLAPQIRRESMSRPSWSVPSQAPSLNGGRRRLAGAVTLGSASGRMGAARAMATITTTMARPTTARLLRLSRPQAVVPRLGRGSAAGSVTAAISRA